MESTKDTKRHEGCLSAFVTWIFFVYFVCLVDSAAPRRLRLDYRETASFSTLPFSSKVSRAI